MAVAAMASPVRARRRKGSGNRVRTGDAGCSRSTVKTQAEIMKTPSSAASIAYSGQCLAKVAAARRNVPGLNDTAAHPRFLGEVVISSVLVTMDGIRKQAGSDREFVGSCEQQRNVKAGDRQEKLLAEPSARPSRRGASARRWRRRIPRAS